MKKIIIIFFCLLKIQSSSAQKINDQFKYFDVKGLQISRAKFEDRRQINKYLDVQGDSANH